MLHILIGIGFVVLTAALACCYVFVLLLLFFCIRWCGAAISRYIRNFKAEALAKRVLEMWPQRYAAHNFPEPEPYPSFFRQTDKRLLALTALFVFSVAGFLYLNQRTEWMGEDNAHLIAKEYFVAGQVVYGFRTILAEFLRPDNLLAKPFVKIQESIYNLGIVYLPENDGERGIWFSNWFVYLFGKRFISPRDPEAKHYSPRMRAFLDPIWTSIEQAATLPFADRKMEVKQHYRNFPGEVFYYNFKKKHYADRVLGSAKFYTRDARMVARSKLLVRWLTELEAKWQNSPETLSFLRKHPDVLAYRQVVLMMELADVITSETMAGTFSCKSNYLRHYIRLRSEFVGDGTTKPPYQRVKDPIQSQMLYKIAIVTLRNCFIAYVAQNYCDIEVAGKEDMSQYPHYGGPTREHHRARQIKNLFKDEIIKLEETHHILPHRRLE